MLWTVIVSCLLSLSLDPHVALCLFILLSSFAWLVGERERTKSEPTPRGVRELLQTLAIFLLAL